MTYVRELTVSYRLRPLSTGPPVPTGKLMLPEDAARTFLRLLGREVVEVCGVLCLTSGLRLDSYHELSRGTLDQTILVPRDVFRVALLANAKSIIVGHNHPSGSLDPSPEDVSVTSALSASGTILGIQLLDQIIVNGEGQFYSFKAAGRL